MSIRVHRLSDEDSLPPVDHTLRLTWDGNIQEREFHFGLGSFANNLVLSVAFPEPESSPKYKQGEFVEGLWEREVFELFWGEKGSSRYQELNLSPEGAWWSAAFVDYRKREEVPIDKRGAFVLAKEGVLTLVLPSAALPVPFRIGPSLRLNATAILFDDSKPVYLSFHQPPATKPDFHLEDLRR